MSEVQWGNYAEAYRQLHVKLDEILSQVAKTSQLPASLSSNGNLRAAVSEALPQGSNVIGKVNVATDKVFKIAKIDHAVAGDNEVVAGVQGKALRVYAVVLVVSAAVNCRWKRGSTDITGDMNFGGKGEGYALAVTPPAYVMATLSGESLVLNLSASVAVDGHVCYWEE